VILNPFRWFRKRKARKEAAVVELRRQASHAAACRWAAKKWVKDHPQKDLQLRGMKTIDNKPSFVGLALKRVVERSKR
jgi:hypothetical protein